MSYSISEMEKGFLKWAMCIDKVIRDIFYYHSM